MQPPRPQFTIQRMMIVLAIVGLFFGLIMYRQRLRMTAALHESEAFQLHNPISVIGTGPVGTIHRKIPGQPGAVAYQPTPQGMDQMKSAEKFAHAASNIEKLLVALAFVLIVVGMGLVLPAIRRGRNQQNASPAPQGGQSP